MVRVNNKPQHIVFCWYFAHLLSKHRHLPVESRKRPCLARRRAVCFAPKSKQTLKQTQGPPRFLYHHPTVVLRWPPHKAQNWCRIAPRLCELWTSGPLPQPNFWLPGISSRRGGRHRRQKRIKFQGGLLRWEVPWNQCNCSFFGCRKVSNVRLEATV